MDLSCTVENLSDSSLHLQEGFPKGVGRFFAKNDQKAFKTGLESCVQVVSELLAVAAPGRARFCPGLLQGEKHC